MGKIELRSMLSTVLALILPNLWSVQAHNVLSINLDRLYPEKQVTVNKNQCNFLQMEDKTVVFFYPDERVKFCRLITGEISECVSQVALLAPAAKTVSYKSVVVKWVDKRLCFDSHIAMKSEVRRSRINPKWQVLESYYSQGQPGNGRNGSSVIELPDNKFLVTGGVLSDHSNRPNIAQISKSAQIFDGDSNTVIKTFKLATERSGHRSLPLSDGRILLVGGVAEGGPIGEIVDLSSGTSVILNAKCNSKRLFYTACVDKNDNCYFLCGTSNDAKLLKTVEMLNVREDKLVYLDKLRLSQTRMFFHRFGINYEPDNALFIADNLLLISGGITEDPMFSEGRKNVKNAERVEFLH